MIIPVFLPHGGCPERCTFCDQRISGGAPAQAARVAQTIEEHLRTGAVAREIAFYGGTFTALPRERQLAYLEAARPYLESGRIGATRVSTRPDAIDPEWLGTLRERYGLAVVELGAQSFNPRVLERLGRSHSVADTLEASRILRELGLKIGLHLLIGCPGEDAGEDARTIAALEALRPDFLRIHPLLVLKGTALENEWRRGEFEALGLEQAVERAARLVEAVEKLGIRVIRLGLQPNEDLEQGSVLAGAYHPAFGDLVRGRRLRNRMEHLLGALAAQTGDEAWIEAPERLAGTLKGPGKTNLHWLQQRFNLSQISVRVLKETDFYDAEVKVRIHRPAGPSQRGKVEPA